MEFLRANSDVVQYPAGMQEGLVSVLTNCDSVTKEMSVLLSKISSVRLARRIQWTVSGQRDMNKLRASLESHKSALNIALGLTTMYVGKMAVEGLEDTVNRTNSVQTDDCRSETRQARSTRAVRSGCSSSAGACSLTLTS